MSEPKLSESDFIRFFEELGPTEVSRRYGMTVTNVYHRRVRLEKKLGRQIKAPDKGQHFRTRLAEPHPAWIQLEVDSGVVIAGSDAHFWPGERSTAFRGLLKLAEELRPKCVVMNGDVFDGARISRFPPIGWENRPTVQQEIEACKQRLSEIEDKCHRARRIWTLGNHCSRFETRLATVAPEFAKIHGFHLKDFFPAWENAWALAINGDVVVKHRFKGGVHATHNNTLWAGKTMVTGHLHSAKVTPLTDYNGTRYGVDSGTMADPTGPQFTDYTEVNPLNWRSAFVVLTFWKGRLLMPQLALVMDEREGLIEFQGKVYKV